MFKIEEIEFKDVKPIWDNYLWPGRNSKKTNSWVWNVGNPAMLSVCEDNKHAYTRYLGVLTSSGKILGVNSFYTIGEYTRSRGLYVNNKYRHLGLGKQLLNKTIDLCDTKYIWSVPRKEALEVYKSAGFVVQSTKFEGSYGTNFIASYKLKDA